MYERVVRLCHNAHSVVCFQPLVMHTVQVEDTSQIWWQYKWLYKWLV
jgi:hypothetical protein